jgi:polysaccharide pyruvyl transferase WcaK-like protein
LIFYLAGQTSFGNRGCEALVRGTVDILRECFGSGSRFLVPSVDAAADAAQWPGHEQVGVEFVAAPQMPRMLRTWCSLAQRLGPLKGLQPPLPRYAPAVEADLMRADAVLMIGGDIVSLDYGVHSLYFWTRLIDRARQIGKPTFLWAASVGPFQAIPRVVAAMREHLAGYRGITVRESTSAAYLRDHYSVAAEVVGDPAFRLAVTEPRSFLGVDEARVAGSVGINLSPLVDAIAAQGSGTRRSLDAEIIEFLEWLAVERGQRITLLYHVDQVETPGNSDRMTMQRLQAQLSERVTCYSLPPGLNACELKWAISRMATLVAARTHATIAAFSQGVPALSIGYSRKARALNLDLFGTDRYVIDIRRVDIAGLKSAFDSLQADREAVKATLVEKAAALRVRALISGRMVKPA